MKAVRAIIVGAVVLFLVLLTYHIGTLLMAAKYLGEMLGQTT